MGGIVSLSDEEEGREELNYLKSVSNNPLLNIDPEKLNEGKVNWAYCGNFIKNQKYSQKGFGKHMISGVKEEAKKKCVDIVYAGVEQSNLASLLSIPNFGPTYIVANKKDLSLHNLLGTKEPLDAIFTASYIDEEFKKNVIDQSINKNVPATSVGVENIKENWKKISEGNNKGNVIFAIENKQIIRYEIDVEKFNNLANEFYDKKSDLEKLKQEQNDLKRESGEISKSIEQIKDLEILKDPNSLNLSNP